MNTKRRSRCPDCRDLAGIGVMCNRCWDLHRQRIVMARWRRAKRDIREVVGAIAVVAWLVYLVWR